MSKLLNSEDFGNKIYERFPELYRRDDQYYDYALKRYIQSAGEGFKAVIDEYNGIADLRDSQKIDEKFLPVIYSSHGLELFNGIPVAFLRNLVPALNTSFSRKGSVSAIEYICSVISGAICNIEIDPKFSENKHINVTLNVDFDDKDNSPSIEQLKRIVKEFIPFDCNVTMVFSYTFRDTIEITLRTRYTPFKVTTEEGRNLLIDLDTKYTEDNIVPSEMEKLHPTNQSLYEDSCFLNNPRLLLSNNIFLNSFSGYDKIIVNGKTTLRDYNY